MQLATEEPDPALENSFLASHRHEGHGWGGARLKRHDTAHCDAQNTLTKLKLGKTRVRLSVPLSSVTRHTSRSVLTPFSPHFTQRSMVRVWPEAGALARRAGTLPTR